MVAWDDINRFVHLMSLLSYNLFSLYDWSYTILEKKLNEPYLMLACSYIDVRYVMLFAVCPVVKTERNIPWNKSVLLYFYRKVSYYVYGTLWGKISGTCLNGITITVYGDRTSIFCVENHWCCTGIQRKMVSLLVCVTKLAITFAKLYPNGGTMFLCMYKSQLPGKTCYHKYKIMAQRCHDEHRNIYVSVTT